MTQDIISFLLSFVALFLYAIVGALLAYRYKRADVADGLWGGGFFLVAIIGFAFAKKTLISCIFLGMIFLWAFRLSVHVFYKISKKTEDFRYQDLRGGSKNSYFWLLKRVFFLQNSLLYLIALPILWIYQHVELVSLYVFLMSFSAWLFGFALESIADFQLLQFLKNPKKEDFCRIGVWKYSRHPNFVGEILQWWAIFSICLFLPYGFLFIVSPLLLTFLIVFVSGVKPIELKLKKKPHFQEYINSTPCLVSAVVYNGLIYSFSWYFLSLIGSRLSIFPLLLGLLPFVLIQLFVFKKMDRRSLRLCFPSCVYSLFLGFLQQSILLNTKVISYSQGDFLPPIWILGHFIFFAFTFHSSLEKLFSSFWVAFFVGGFGGTMTYFGGKNLGLVSFESILTPVYLFFAWGCLSGLLCPLIKKIRWIYTNTTDPEILKLPLRIFFDTKCRMCNFEKRRLESRLSSGNIIFDTIEPKSYFDSQKLPFTYRQALESIHALENETRVLSGTKALSALYARMGLFSFAILLEVPIFKEIGMVLYFIWAHLRLKFR